MSTLLSEFYIIIHNNKILQSNQLFIQTYKLSAYPFCMLVCTRAMEKLRSYCMHGVSALVYILTLTLTLQLANTFTFAC